MHDNTRVLIPVMARAELAQEITNQIMQDVQMDILPWSPSRAQSSDVKLLRISHKWPLSDLQEYNTEAFAKAVLPKLREFTCSYPRAVGLGGPLTCQDIERNVWFYRFYMDYLEDRALLIH